MSVTKKVKRVSLFRLKRRGTGDIEKVVSALQSMKDKVSSLIDIEVGVNLSDSAEAYDVVLIVTFKDIKSLRKYEQDPFHLSVKEIVVGLKENRAVVDYEF